ncbi:MAG: HD domain-containing protein [Desulfarculaceae bacterium]|nr:HD domain-containing protein [Desulfarculaceae bacterium]MCF8102842.1 HD domain-containing protein [Desulfarculaceae bacterium]MCF8116286.1 HD domain-containing protein [Desulfarculaceae bacterium]
MSNAMDLANPEVNQHQLRTAFIVWEMGRAAGLSAGRLEKVFTAALLHDIGAISVEEKTALHEFEVENVEEHCIRGRVLFESVPWLKEEALLVRFHHKKWLDWAESIESPTVFDSQLIYLADYVERLVKRGQFILHQPQAIAKKVKLLSGRAVHTEIVDLFLQNAGREEFWLDLAAPRMYSLLLNDGPYTKKEVGLSDLTLIAQLFRNIIDFRSRFTATHSSGVATAATTLAQLRGFTERDVHLMEVAGNLHDIGKMAIPNSILEKPGKLDAEEMATMKSHTYHTYEVINSIQGMQGIAQWAAFHHEKLDGSGYPFHHQSPDLDNGARIMAVADVFTALAEDRPYRQGMPKEKIVRILSGMAKDKHLYHRTVDLLVDNMDLVSTVVGEQQAQSQEFYQNQLAFLGDQ